MYVKFDVYVNAVDETIIGPESREFAGRFVNMKRGVRILLNKGNLVVKRKTNFKVGITELLEDLEADGDETIWVTLVHKVRITPRVFQVYFFCTYCFYGQP
ncbi:hypothetical protein MKW98_029144 [Papaver atlanticum]|uniref:Polyphenol oxidase C-terminal domain-containing protein n=1 Tax=Papaver atlanticum TaxID=357466 RepID=A0AAD4S9Z7_9MAGN|nr:hypothetical protein MKW98_029144 [Papaver atlanticum]